MTSRRAGADIDAARTALAHVPELRDLLRRHRQHLSKADREIIEVACAVMEEGAARLMLRNGVGLVQAELALVGPEERSAQPMEQVG